TYATAGHNPPRVKRGERILPLDACIALPLGIERDESFPQAIMTLERGDLLMLYTDGITETPAPARGAFPRQLLGLSSLDTLLLTCGAKTAPQFIDCICAQVSAFSGHAPPRDDQTLVAIRCL